MTTLREKNRPPAQRLVKTRPAKTVEAPYEMANLYPRDTGLPMTVWVSPNFALFLGQTFRDRDYGRDVRLRPETRPDRRRGPARRDLRAAHQSDGGTVQCRRDRALLQEPGPGGAGVPVHEDGGSRYPPGVPLDRAARARPCAVVHAGVLPGMAHAPDPGASAVR